MARALWYVAPGVVELRPQALEALKTGEARVRTLFSGISRGTERLVLSGAVHENEWRRMRAPLQSGDFPFPVKYGYCAVGLVEDGPEAWIGRTVFCLHPHQDIFTAPVAMLAALPDGLKPARATLAANMETALNALWDSEAGPGDRIVIVGAGIVGLMVAALAAAIPGTEVTVVDVARNREPLVRVFGARFLTPGEATPGAAPGRASRQVSDQALGADCVFHTSATDAGLATAIACAGLEANVIELSWYGGRPVSAGLGGAFHSQRLRLISSQVGQVAPSRRPRWTYARRLAKALELLCDARFDALIADEIAFNDLPRLLPGVLSGPTDQLPPVIAYQPAS